MPPHFTTLALLLLILLFAAPSTCVVSEQGVQDIQSAIHSAILDGLDTVDTTMRNTYWFYLRGGNLTSYNASIKADHLNYIILYITGSNVYRVNCDITFAQWKAVLNSFVQLEVSTAGLAAIKNNVQILAQSSNYLDLTDSNLLKNSPPPAPTPPVPTQTPPTSTSSTTSTATTETPFPSASGVIVLKPISSNLSTNS